MWHQIAVLKAGFNVEIVWKVFQISWKIFSYINFNIVNVCLGRLIIMMKHKSFIWKYILLTDHHHHQFTIIYFIIINFDIIFTLQARVPYFRITPRDTSGRPREEDKEGKSDNESHPRFQEQIFCVHLPHYDGYTSFGASILDQGKILNYLTFILVSTRDEHCWIDQDYIDNLHGTWFPPLKIGQCGLFLIRCVLWPTSSWRCARREQAIYCYVNEKLHNIFDRVEQILFI